MGATIIKDIMNNTILIKKDVYDKFHTHPSIVKRVMRVAKDHIDFSTVDQFIEPSAGAGIFLDEMPENTKAYDLVPEDNGRRGIIRQNFLDTTEDSDNITYIGNPPFGFAGSLAVKFFNHCASIDGCWNIVFILPRSFNKISIQNRLSLDFGLVYTEDLPKFSFLLHGEPYGVPCCVQVWERLDTPRIKVKPPKNIWFTITENEADCDFCVRRTGGKAGKVIEKTGSVTKSSTHFIKAVDGVDDLEDVIRGINFDKYADNTAGVRSVSATEILIELGKHYGT